MGAPEFIWLGMELLGLGVCLAKDGKPKEGKYNFWITLFVFAIEIVLLNLGGFFK